MKVMNLDTDIYLSQWLSMDFFKLYHYFDFSVYVLHVDIYKALCGQAFSEELRCVFLKILPFLPLQTMNNWIQTSALTVLREIWV